jgi:hypothetical protein
MAKQKAQAPQPKAQKYPYPSRYGSHHSMRVPVPDELKDLVVVGQVVCQDENGTYITDFDRLDNGRADPNRYRESRLKIAAA